MNDKEKYPADELLALIRILENKGLDALEKLELVKVIIYFMFYTKGVMI